MKYLYGPVPSRRLGRSLGIDPFEKKTCTHNCIYCQLGNGVSVSANELVERVSVDCVKDELRRFFESDGECDFVTFSGSGEPTLWKHTGEIVDFVRTNFPSKKIAVITNGTMLWREDVREQILGVDVIVPTISAADEDTYIRLHRPNPDASFELQIRGVKEFARIFEGEIWAEVMLVADVNDSEEHILKLREFLRIISPTYIDINTPVRPPSERWVHPPNEEIVRKICVILGENCRIVGKFQSISKEVFEIANLATRILDILRRRPETAQSIAESLSTSIENVEQACSALVAKRLAVKVSNDFYEAKIMDNY
ncbi:radical SAM protein [bacterium]|nr:radical SAM protein [bacterium]